MTRNYAFGNVEFSCDVSTWIIIL